MEKAGKWIHLARSWDVDESVDVDIGEGGHQELAVESEEGILQSRICQFS